MSDEIYNWRHPYSKFHEASNGSGSKSLGGKKKSVAKKMSKNEAIDKKYAKLASEKGLTPSGKRKWHFYNTNI